MIRVKIKLIKRLIKLDKTLHFPRNDKDFHKNAQKKNVESFFDILLFFHHNGQFNFDCRSYSFNTFNNKTP